MMRHRSLRAPSLFEARHGAARAVALLAGAALAACAGDGADGAPDFGSGAPPSSTTARPATTAPGGTAGNGQGSPPPASGAVGPGATGDNGAPGSLNGNGNTPSTNGSNGGTGGSSATGAMNPGSGGSSMAMAPGTAAGGSGGNQPPVPAPTTPPPVPTTAPVQPAAPDIPCPADATFCSGFEGTNLPAPSRFVIGGDSSFMPQFTLDGTQPHSGEQSFMIPAMSPGFSYRALTIPAPGQDFWARMFVRVDTTFGDGNHDSLFGASNANQTQDNNNEVLIELSEQFGYMLLNTDDCTTACNTSLTRLQLPANTWGCFEAHYDGVAGHVEIFLNGTRFIDDTQAIYRFTYQTFRIGYMRFNTQRTVWFDDVVVARSQVGCN